MYVYVHVFTVSDDNTFLDTISKCLKLCTFDSIKVKHLYKFCLFFNILFYFFNFIDILRGHIIINSMCKS